MRFLCANCAMHGGLWAAICLCRHSKHPEIRATLPGYAQWPTFPQLWVEGELVGGCDIITEMFESGELETLLTETAAKYETSDE